MRGNYTVFRGGIETLARSGCRANGGGEPPGLFSHRQAARLVQLVSGQLFTPSTLGVGYYGTITIPSKILWQYVLAVPKIAVPKTPLEELLGLADKLF